MSTEPDEIEIFIAERNEALLSLDEQKIRAMFRKWNDVEMTENPTLFWLSVHKAITGCTGLPIDFRRKSKAWLEERGSRRMDDGDL